MLTEIDGHLYYLHKLPNESLSQLAERKRFVFAEAAVDHSIVADRIALSKFFHNIYFKGCKYPQAIMDKVSQVCHLMQSEPKTKK